MRLKDVGVSTSKQPATARANDEKVVVPGVYGVWARRIVAFAEAAASERVLDLASRRGVVAANLVGRIGTNTAAPGGDSSLSMLATAGSLDPEIESFPARRGRLARGAWRPRGDGHLPQPATHKNPSTVLYS